MVIGPELRCLCMKPIRGARVDLEFIVHRPNVDPLYPPQEAKAEEVSQISHGSHKGGSREVDTCQGHKRSV